MLEFLHSPLVIRDELWQQTLTRGQPPLHPLLIARLSYWIILLWTHLPAASAAAQLECGIRLPGTWFSLVSGETTAINKKENLSNTVTSHDFHICLTLILLYFLLPRFWERTLLFFFFLFSILTLCVCVCYRSCSLSTPARHLHKKTRAKAAPSLPWTSVTSWPPSGTTCWLRLSRRIWFQLSYYIFLF